MSADNYALIGIHPLAGTGLFPTTLHGVYVGFMSSDYRPSEIPESCRSFATHEEAEAYANELFTEYGLAFLCDCTDEDEKSPAPKKTVRQVVAEHTAKAEAYADALETEHGLAFLFNCPGETDDENEKPQLSEWEKELLYPATKKTVRQVIAEYADTLDHIYSARTAGDFTWKGLLHEFMEENAMTEELELTDE